jgi:hypothetical protein
MTFIRNEETMAFSNQALKDAFDRLEQRKAQAKQAEEGRRWKAEQILKPPMPPSEIELNRQTARDLRHREKLITGMENLMKRDYSTFMERFSDHYARLTGATTN